MKPALVFLACMVSAIGATTTEPPPTCGNTEFYDQTGVITSPNHPEDYPYNLNCSFYIHASTGSSFSFIFTSFNTETGVDFVTLLCPTNSSYIPRKVSGWYGLTSVPGPVSMPWCSQAQVHFSSNSIYAATGFSFNYYVSYGGCGNTLFNESTRYVTSPSYPENYGSDQNCSTIIYATQRGTFYLYFHEFEVEDDCTHDWMEISCLDNAEYGHHKFCGNHTLYEAYIYDCSQLLLWFHSDGSNNYQGFNIEYSYIDLLCGGSSHYDPYGVITSPNYPGNYYNDLDCDDYIYASTGSSLSLIFNSLSTEVCCDWVTISCTTNSSFLEQHFSGYLPNPVSIPWCSQGLVNFYTDVSAAFKGFSLDYYVSNGGCGNTVYKDAFGFVTTPNYPNPYGANQNCTNIIWAPQQSTFYLQFQGFNLEIDCNRDWLEISCLEGAAFGPSRYCGSIEYTTMYVYECSRLLLWFHSDGSTNTYLGFNIEYNVNPESGGNTDFEYTYPTTATPRPTPGPAETGYTDSSHPPTATMDEICGETAYFDSYGVIRSPNYPGYYDNYLYCDYYIYADSGSSLSFIFKSFHVENPDFVTISCLSNSNFPPHEYSGHALPEPLPIPVCSQARINFRTDYTNVSSGFSIEYYVHNTGCGNTVYLGSNGHVNSPFWPNGYGYNQNCSNIIWATEQSTIQLIFRSFNLQDNCSADWVEISCLDNSDHGPNRYCGNYNSHELFIYHCTQVLLWFHSDESSNYPGFNIEYTVYPVAACGETSYYDPSGVISSPNYPGNYSNFLFCDYTVYASTRSDLLFIFTSFHIQEKFDFVTFSCPANTSYPKYEFTGDFNPGPLSLSSCSQGLVNFHTDDTVVSSGFSLTYYVNEGGCGNTLYYPSSGNVTSPNWPSNYGSNQNCSNIIYAWERSTFYLNFQSLILQSCCSCDWLEVSCIDNPDNSPTRYCGSYPTFGTYIYNCSQVLLWFHSDESGSDQGFNIEYTVYQQADISKVPSNGKSNAAENVFSNGKPKAADKAPSDGKPNSLKNVPNHGMDAANAGENVFGNGKQNAAEKRREE